jgi:hypothetical protein
LKRNSLIFKLSKLIRHRLGFRGNFRNEICGMSSHICRIGREIAIKIVKGDTYRISRTPWISCDLVTAPGRSKTFFSST